MLFLHRLVNLDFDHRWLNHFADVAKHRGKIFHRGKFLPRRLDFRFGPENSIRSSSGLPPKYPAAIAERLNTATPNPERITFMCGS